MSALVPRMATNHHLCPRTGSWTGMACLRVKRAREGRTSPPPLIGEAAVAVAVVVVAVAVVVVVVAVVVAVAVAVAVEVAVAAAVAIIWELLLALLRQ